jgi:hypothetical protein
VRENKILYNKHAKSSVINDDELTSLAAAITTLILVLAATPPQRFTEEPRGCKWGDPTHDNEFSTIPIALE